MSVPKSKNAKISYYESHVATFVSQAAGLGVDPALAADLQTKTTAARASYNTQQTAKNSLKTAIGNCDLAVGDMAVVGAQVLTQIRAKAKVAGDGIWTLAGLPIPPVPGPVPPPGVPEGFKVVLDGNGNLVITWKANNPANGAGTFYRIYRTIEGQPQTYLGDVGGRKFIDTTLPVGATYVTYAIQGARTTASGPWGNFVVKFGTNAGGQAVASIAQTMPKLAA